jgi:hypothetical protein
MLRLDRKYSLHKFSRGQIRIAASPNIAEIELHRHAFSGRIVLDNLY